MTKREFVEQAAIRFRAGWRGDTTSLGESAEDAVEAAIELWDEIEKRVPRDRDPTLGGLLGR